MFSLGYYTKFKLKNYMFTIFNAKIPLSLTSLESLAW
jgi:hypothetical protein